MHALELTLFSRRICWG